MHSNNSLHYQPSAQSLAKLSFLDLSQTMINPNFSQQNLNIQQTSSQKPCPSPFREQSPEPKQLLIEELLSLINKKSIQLAKKRGIDDLTLMELLNGFDVVVAEKKPRTDIANHVYRMILRQEREKQYSSIQDLSTEIKALKQFEREETKQPLGQIDQNIMNTNQFDFQGSFGEEDRNRIFNSCNKENINHQIKQKLNFPKISLDNVLEMQKLESFQNRCNKLSMIERQQVKHNFRPSESVEMRSTTPNFLNKDLEIVQSMISPPKILNVYHRDQQQTKLQLPKLNLSGLIRQSPSSINKRSQSVNQYAYNNERAIDSDRAIAFAYYTRRLLLNGWRAFYNYHLDKSNNRVLDKIGQSRYAKNTKKRMFRALHQQAKQHYGHGTQNKRALAFFQLRTAMRYLKKWRQEAHDTMIEREKLEIIQEHLTQIRKRQIFTKLKNAALKLQVQSVQSKTSQHIYRQRYLRKSLMALRYFVAFRQHLRKQHQDAKRHNVLRLRRSGMRVLQLNVMQKQKYREMNRVALGIRELNLLKLSVKQMKEFMLKKMQYVKLNNCAQNYYNLNLMKTAIELLRKYSLLMQGVNKQKFYIDTYYQKKLKFNLFNYILASNMIFIEEESNIMVMKKRLRLRKYFGALIDNYRQNRVTRVPQQNSFYFACYQMLKHSFSKLVDQNQQIPYGSLSYNQFMNKSKVPYYQKLHKNAQFKLKAYYLQKIISAWRGDTQKLREFINKRQNLLKFKLMRYLRVKSRANAKYKFLLNQLMTKKQNYRLKKAFSGLVKYQRSKKFERLIVLKMNQVRQDKKIEKVFINLKLYYKKKVFRQNQKQIADDLFLNNKLNKPFNKWRGLFLKINKRREMLENQQDFNRTRLLKKYMQKMIDEFSKIALNFQKLKNYHQTLRRKQIKKVLCGFLSNILINQQKRNKLQIALGYLKHNLLIKSLKTWQYMLPELKQKNFLYKMISSDKSTKLQQKVFNTLKLYYNFQLNKKTVDHMMTRNIQLITQKRFLKHWQSSLNKRVGFKLLEHVFEKHRSQEFMMRVAKKIHYENSVISHMKIFQMFKLLEFTFNMGLKKNVSLKYKWSDNWDKIQINRVKFGKLQHLRKWQKQYRQAQKEYKMTYFTIIQIKNQIIKKYFQVLKNKMLFNKLKQRTIQNSKLQRKQKYFLSLKKLVKSRVNCVNQYNTLSKQFRKQKLGQVLDTWINEINELMIVRNFSKDRILKMKASIIKQWQGVLQQESKNRTLINYSKQITDNLILQQYFRLIHEHKIKSQNDNQKIYQHQQAHQSNLLKNVLVSLRSYINQNRDTIKKVQQIRKRVSTRKLRFNFRLWTKSIEDTLIKIRVLHCLGQINRNIETRCFFYRWFDFTEQSQIIDQIAEKHHQIKLVQQKQDALRQLRQFKERRVMQRDRVCTIEDYWVKKTQLKFLTMLRFSVKLIKRRRDNKVRAYEFSRDQLMRKAMVSFAYQSQKNEQFRILTAQYQHSLKAIHAPKFFDRLRNFTYKLKEQKIKNQFAFAFMSNRLLQATFKSLLMSYLYKKDQRMRQNRAFIFKCDSLIKNGFNSLKTYTYSRKLQNQKRMLLSQTIMRFDQSQTLYLAFRSFKLNHDIQRDIFIQARGQIVLTQLQNIMNILKQNAKNKQQLKSKGKMIQKQHKEIKMRAIMHKWMRALDNEAKVKVIQRNRQQLYKNRVYDELKHQYTVKRFQFIKLNNKALSYQRTALIALYKYSQKQKKLRNVQSDLLFTNMQRTLSRSFMGLRFQTLLIKNQRVLQQKQNRMLAIKSLSGWKYQIILEKTYRQYSELKYKKELSQYFCNWFNLYKYQTTQRNLLGDLIIKKDITEKKSFFTQWKRQAYHDRFIDLLQVNYTFPHQRYIAARCLKNWRKYTKLNQQKQELIEQTQNISESLLASRVLREWFEVSQVNIPARILEQRMSRAVNRLLKVKAFYLINVQGYRNQFIEENLDAITTKRDMDVRRDFFNEWRKQFAINQLQKIIQIKNQRQIMKGCLQALKSNCIKEIENKDITSRINDYIKSTTLATQICLAKTFAQCGIKQNNEVIYRQYYNRLKVATDHQRSLKQMKQKAQQYLKYKIYMKYFYQMMQTFYVNHQDKAYDQQGYQVWSQKVQKKVLHAFAVNTLQQRKYHNADMFYYSKLLQQSFNALRLNLHYTKQKSQLNTRMMYFLKKKCIHIFKLSFTQWRVKFEHRQYGKQAVCEYHNFRNNKLKRMAFDYFVAIIQQRLQIKDMVTKAQKYFDKKNYLKLAHKCFYALRDHAVTHKHKTEQFQDRELMALKFYAFNLITSHLRAWKKEVRVNRNRQKRSKMYSIFSAWKFYTKERVLLKKYLQECNMAAGTSTANQNQYHSGLSSQLTQRQQIDPNLMSTQEMRENVARFSNLQSDFCEGMSQGTPFVTSTDRKILGSNPNIVNSASPHSNYNNFGDRGNKVDTRSRSGSQNNRISVGMNINQNKYNSNYNSANQGSKIQHRGAGMSAGSMNRKYM